MGSLDFYTCHLPNSFPVIFDSGASLAISSHLDDFASSITCFTEDRRLGDMAGGMRIEGQGTIKWSFHIDKGIITVHYKYVIRCQM